MKLYRVSFFSFDHKILFYSGGNKFLFYTEKMFRYSLPSIQADCGLNATLRIEIFNFDVKSVAEFKKKYPKFELFHEIPKLPKLVRESK